MSIHQLTSQHFTIVGRQRKALSLQMGGAVLVFFKMQSCQGCAAFEPIFNQLAAEDRRVGYAVIDIGVYRDVVGMSRQTTTPIQTVPTIILYIEGRPHAKPKKKDIMSLRSFLSGALSKAPPQAAAAASRPSQQPFMPNQQYPQPQQKYYQPEMDGRMPSMKGVRGGGNGQSMYAQLNQADEDDDMKMLIPEQITPHNKPWDSGYRKMGTLD